jgi:tetratricopeptide (TPR) repeat protein
LGDLYVMTGRHKRAHALIEEAISLNEKGAPNPIYMARTLTNLATLYALQMKWNLAESELVRAQQVLDTSVGPFHPELATVLHNLGAVYTAQKKFSNAEVVLRRALEIRTRAFGTENLIVNETKMHLADALAESGQFDEAEALYAQSLQTQEQLSGLRSPDVALILENLARVLRLKIDQQAKAMEERAKAIRKEQGLMRSVH